jgi:hypothetical protein
MIASQLTVSPSILYERLSMIPPSPELHGRALPPGGMPAPAPAYLPPHAVTAEQALALEASDHARRHSQGGPRLAPIALQPERSRGPVEEITIGPGMIPPPHALPALPLHAHGPPLPETEAYRHLPPLPAIPGPPRAHHHLPSPSDVSAGAGRAHALAHSASPPMDHPAPPPPPHAAIPGHPPPPAPRALSPSTSSRSSGHGHHHYTNTGRIHNHQRMGPGVNINQAEWDRQRDERERHHEQREREREWEREQEREREREYEREREFRMMRERELERQRDMEAHAHHARERDPPRRAPSPSYGPSLRGGARETPPPPRYEPRASRSDTPSSAGGLREAHPDAPARPDSARSQPGPPYPEPPRGSALAGPGVDSRKRSRGDMEVDEEPGPRRGEDVDAFRHYADERERGYKRHHPQDEPMEATPGRDAEEAADRDE